MKAEMRDIMGNLKKMMFALLCVVLFGMTSVSAMSVDELKEVLTKKYEINGVTFQITNAQKNSLEQYLTNNPGITESDADYIASKVDEVIAILEEANVKSVDDLTRSTKDKIKALITDVSNNTAIKATPNNDGTVTIYNLDNTVFDKITVTGDSEYTDSTIVISLASAIALCGIIVIAKNSRKANA